MGLSAWTSADDLVARKLLAPDAAPSFMAEAPGLNATAMQAVGVKGHDGFAIALVTQ